MDPRRATIQDIGAVAHLWHDAWHETQAPYVPNDLIQRRTLAEFESRVSAMVQSSDDTLRIAGPLGAPLAMCAIKQNEMYQLFVAPKGRGTGIAATMLADAETRLRALGCQHAFLDCLIENEQAIKFYTKQGWHNAGQEIALLDTNAGAFELPCLKFRKALT